MTSVVNQPAALIIKAGLVIIVVFSIGNFNEKFLPAGTLSNLQQYIALTMWILVLCASLFLPPILRVAPSADIIVALAFCAFAVLSIAWSNHSPDSVLKGLALVITTVGAYRLACRMPIDQIMNCTIVGLLVLVAGSAFLVAVLADIGLVTTWMHNGQWQGVFESKQSLGTGGAFLMFFASHRALTRGGMVSFLIMFGLGAGCVIGSGSRGGGALALAAIATLYLSARFPRVGKLLAFGPIAMIVVANALSVYFVATGNDYLSFFDYKIDFTDRTLIWEYALRHFEHSALFGFGLNGFWSIDQIHYWFSHEHEWVLDNFHSGYVAILVETGVIGMALFTLCFLFFGARMSWLSSTQLVSRAHYNVIIGFVNLSFLINFTETFFLRSTNFIATLLTAFLVIGSASQSRMPQQPDRSPITAKRQFA
jgi:exopolysaccharide production protein ExoQ